MEQKIIVRVAHSGDASFANAITDEMASSAKARGTGIAKRSPDYVAAKINEGKSVIAYTEDGTCLLYTSPSPRDRTRSRMPSSA